MRDEDLIFKDLAALCASPGYIHALAYFSFRDSVIRYSEHIEAEDVQHLFSSERLIRTETSTLFGLMIQKEVIFGLPAAALLQRYIDDTEALLKEIHEAMSWETVSEMRSGIESGRLTNPFGKGSALREPIFYGSESAYSFQYRDISVPKYEADDKWLETNLGFSIGTARDLAHALTRIQNDKFTRTIDELSSLPPDAWTFLPSFTFTPLELSKGSGFDLPIVERFLSAFLLPPTERNLGFQALDDFNVVTAMPLISTKDRRLVLFEQYSLLQSLYESPFYWMGADKKYVDTAMLHRGRFVEKFATQRLGSVFGMRSVHTNVKISGAKGKDTGEIDVLVLFGNRAIIVQAKSKRLTLEARKGNDNMLRGDFQRSVQDSYDQGLMCARALETNPILLDASGNRIWLPERLKEIYIFCVVADHYPALSFQAHQFLKYETSSTIQAPFILDVFTLDAMAEMLEAPLSFLSYVNRRTNYHEKILAQHELTILSYHLKHNLWFDPKYSLVSLEDDFTVDLDLAMMVRREGVPGERTPDGILTRFGNTALGRIVRKIESKPDSGTIDLGFALLTLSEETVTNFSRKMEEMAQLAKQDGRHHDISMPMGETGEGLTIHCNRDAPPFAAERLEAHCLMRKYAGKARRWFGICIWPGDGELRFGINLDFSWESNSKMEALMASKPLRGGYVSLRTRDGRMEKVGRNDPCPCGSGRKFKKCCSQR